MALNLLKTTARRLKAFLVWPSFTVEYPFVVRQPSAKARIGLRNNFADCTGCLDCQKSCPVHCIEIHTDEFESLEKAPKTSKGILFERKVTSFKIDFNRCTYCGICVEHCPTGSLSENKESVVSRSNQRHLVVDLQHQPRSIRREQGFEE